MERSSTDLLRELYKRREEKQMKLMAEEYDMVYTHTSTRKIEMPLFCIKIQDELIHYETNEMGADTKADITYGSLSRDMWEGVSN